MLPLFIVLIPLPAVTQVVVVVALTLYHLQFIMHAFCSIADVC